jgi:ATP-binding cassette subfamily F protein 3
MLLRLEGVARAFPTRTLFRGVELVVNAGDRIGLVGPNGAGKSTLLRIAAGLEPPDAGRVVRPRDVRVGLLGQEVDPRGEESAREEVASALAALALLERELRELEARMAGFGETGGEVPAELARRYDRARAAFEFGGGFEREARVERVLAGLGFDAEAAGRPLAELSGGWRMRVELAKLLVSAPDVLLLDEPTNHLDLPSIEWFEATLAGFRGAVVMISHDRTLLRRHATHVAELEAGRFDLHPGSFDRYLEEKARRREGLEARRREQEREVARTERLIERFRYQATKARMVQSRIKALARRERVELPPESRARIRLRIPDPRRSGEEVLRLAGVHKRFGERRVYAGLDFLVRRGERVALVGPNGAGKSTLLRIAAGLLPTDAGTRTLGHHVEVAFYAQHQLEVLDPARTVLEELARVARTEDVPRLRGHLGAFLFSGDEVEKRVAVLSGGEKARLALARMLLRPANFLVMDEPTNHLDLAACEVLEAALGAYAGTLLFISHDRALIDAIATRVVEVRDGRLADHFGGEAARPPRSEAEPSEGLLAGALPPSSPPGYASWCRPAAAREAAAGSGESPASAGARASRSARAEARAPEARAPASVPLGPSAEARRARIARREREKQVARELARGRRRLAALEEEIASLEQRLEELGARLARPEAWRDGAGARSLEVEHESLREGLAARYREWETLAAALEAAGGAEA